MTGLTITVMRLGPCSAILWIFVLLALGVVRTDLFGAGRPAPATARRAAKTPAPAAAPAGRGKLPPPVLPLPPRRADPARGRQSAPRRAPACR